MNYGDLKARVLEYSFRPDLTTQVGTFISLAEGMIRRELVAMPLSVVLDETDRVADGVYTLPAETNQIRAIYTEDDRALKQVSLEEIKRLPAQAFPYHYSVIGDGTVEFRGVPPTDAELTVQYLGHPAAFSSDSDENELLTAHEAVYVYGALFHLYQYTQDIELAQTALDTYGNVIEQLNQQYGRKIGGARIAPAYHFGPVTRGY